MLKIKLECVFKKTWAYTNIFIYILRAVEFLCFLFSLPHSSYPCRFSVYTSPPSLVRLQAPHTRVHDGMICYF